MARACGSVFSLYLRVKPCDFLSPYGVVGGLKNHRDTVKSRIIDKPCEEIVAESAKSDALMPVYSRTKWFLVAVEVDRKSVV